MKAFWASCFLALSAAASIAQQSATGNEPIPASVAALGSRWLADLLTLPPALAIDASLRRQLVDLAAAHEARLKPMFEAWMAAEAALIPTEQWGQQLPLRLTARYMNEIALWRLESPGADYDTVILKALLKQGSCRRMHKKGYFGQHALLLQALSVQDRETALVGERKLFARWGHPRPSLPPRPAPSVADLQAQALSALKNAEPPTHVPMPPVLAFALYRDDRAALTDDAQCALDQWWMASALAAPGADPAKILTAYRYAVMPEAKVWLAGSSDEALVATGYPAVGTLYGVQGELQVHAVLDANARIVRSHLDKRSVTVPGIRDVRPVAFETLFDSLTAPRLAQSVQEQKAAGNLPAKATMVVVPMRWTLH